MLINEAFAQTTTTAAQGGVIEFLTPLVVVIAIFYMLVWRPQGKRMKEHESMVSSLKPGDKVITTGGIHAKVVKSVDETTVILSIAPGVDVTFNSHSVTAMLETGNKKSSKNDDKPVKKVAKKTTKKTAKKTKKAA